MSAVEMLAIWDELVQAARKNLPASEFNKARYAREELVALLSTPKHGDDAEDGLRYVLCKVAFGEHFKDWLMIPHIDGNYVTAAKLVPFSMAILRHALPSNNGEDA